MSEKKKKSNAVVNYFKDVKGEMKKVSWPTFKQLKNNTLIVIVSVILIGALVALLDFGFGKGFEYVVNKDAGSEQSKTIDVENNSVQLDESDVDVDVDTATDTATETENTAGVDDAE